MAVASEGSPVVPRVRYACEVVSVGPEARAFFGEGIAVLFSDDAPGELREFSIIHRPEVTEGGVRAGDRILMGGEAVVVLAVGDVVNDNLRELGHLVLKRNGKTEAELPGDVCCDEGPIPAVSPGDTVRIVAPPEEETPAPPAGKAEA